ncbi:MAG: ubiquitin-like small modifier protein 1 [Planctomycetota bacterium]|jgi:molybdopterin synthase sulfur carrier subunit
MKVNFYATLRAMAGGKTDDFDLGEGATARSLLAAVLERYPDMREELLDEDGELFPHVHLFVNGRDAPHLDDGMETVLKAEDKIDLFPAVAGG